MFLQKLAIATITMSFIGCGVVDPMPGQKPEPVDTTKSPLAQVLVDQIYLPRDEMDYTLDLVGDGVKRNRLGALLAAIRQVVPQIDPQQRIDTRLRDGSFLLLLEVLDKAKADYAADSAASIRSYVGIDLDSDPFNNASGQEEFAVSQASVQAPSLAGRILTGDRIKAGPGELQIILPVGPPPAVTVTLKQARFEATLAAGGLHSGTLAGLLDKDQVSTKLVPAFWRHFQEVYESVHTSQTMRTVLGSLFDTDNSGRISLEEFARSELVRTAQQPDVDSDGDGELDSLSIGLGFGSVRCTIARIE